MMGAPQIDPATAEHEGIAAVRENGKRQDETEEMSEESGTTNSAGVGEEEDEEMTSCMQRRLDALPGKAQESEPFTILRVSGLMRDRNRHLYEPQMVSVGPFHRDAARLRAMEEHKWRYLRDLLEPSARRRYAEPTDDRLPPRDFAEMLLLDVCFIIEFFLKGDDGAADALIDAAWAMQNVYNDLFLLENQLPFFVLERFYHIATDGLGRDHLVTNLLAKYLTVETPQDAATTRPPDGENLHLLHLYYHWFLPSEDDVDDAVPTVGGNNNNKVNEDEAFNEWLAKPMDERLPWLLLAQTDGAEYFPATTMTIDNGRR